MQVNIKNIHSFVHRKRNDTEYKDVIAKYKTIYGFLTHYLNKLLTKSETVKPAYDVIFNKEEFHFMSEFLQLDLDIYDLFESWGRGYVVGFIF
jgi:hypothetical protein